MKTNAQIILIYPLSLLMVAAYSSRDALAKPPHDLQLLSWKAKEQASSIWRLVRNDLRKSPDYDRLEHEAYELHCYARYVYQETRHLEGRPDDVRRIRRMVKEMEQLLRGLKEIVYGIDRRVLHNRYTFGRQREIHWGEDSNHDDRTLRHLKSKFRDLKRTLHHLKDDLWN